MLDIYRLFYFMEETGLLIQEKLFQATHPQIWERSLRRYRQKGQGERQEESPEDVGGNSGSELPGKRIEEEQVSPGTDHEDSGYPVGASEQRAPLCPAFFRRDCSGNAGAYEEDGKNQENEGQS